MKLQGYLATAIVSICLLQTVNAQTIPQRKAPKSSQVAARTIPTTDWTSGAMPDTTGNGTPTTTNLKQLLIANVNLKPLDVTLGGPNLIVCNNPERFTGDGWLFQHSYTDPTQGGVDYPLSGTTRIYMFHLNFTSPAATKYIHLIIHNPGASSITYSYKGANYNNVEKPLTGAAAGQSYWVSRDWIGNVPTTTSGTINANSKLVVFSKVVNSANMFDALYEVTTSGPVYYYTVVTTNNTTAAARAAAAVNAPYASFAMPPDPRVTQSDYRQETGGTYARGSGIFPASEVSSDNVLVVPDVPSRIGFCFNTASKFYPMLEKQNPAILVKTPATNTDTVRSLYSSSHNYGNYGMKYNTTFHLQNNNSTSKTVNIYFAENENLVDAASASGRWNSRFKTTFNSIVTTPDIYIQANNPRKLLRTVTVPAGTTDFSVEVYIPGLITTNHQLIFETTTTAPSTLPVNLSSFTGSTQKYFNQLVWKVEQEYNLSYYEVERKNEQTGFITIQKITATNNASAQQYLYADSTATSNGAKNYYRLKMVNIDGTFKYSNIISLTNKLKNTLQVLGNPFTNKLDIQFQAALGEQVQLSLYDGAGKRIRTVTTQGNGAANTHTFYNLETIKPGMYIVEAFINGNRNSIFVLKNE